MNTARTAAAARLDADLRVLTQDIGVRLAGSDAERRAAEHIAAAGRAAGARVTVEPFPVWQRDVTEEHLEVLVGGTWKTYPASLFSSTPGTAGKLVEAPLVFFEAPTEYSRPDLDGLRGKAVVHLGCHIESRAAYRRLMAAEPAFLLFVDIRYPGTRPLADGMFPAYTRDLGAKPTLNVAYMDAWGWKRDGATAARIRVGGGVRASTSQNVVIELPGDDPRAGILFAGAHHDTQAGSVGADDNGSGVAIVLELARLLAPRPRRHTLRLISFGAEEQLSVGSAEYVRQHRRELESAGLGMVNIDSAGSLLGWTEINANGPEAMVNDLVARFREAGVYPGVSHEVVPYTDQFPFAVAGLPGVWIGRRNCHAGRFFHHLPTDDIEHLSCDLLATQAAAVAETLAAWAASPQPPFSRDIPAEQREAIQTFWEDLYGGWGGLRG